MAQVVYSPSAIVDLDRLHRFLAERNPAAALRAMRTIRTRIRMLQRSPRLGPVDPEQAGYRELFISFSVAGYVARYAVDGSTVVILAVRHMREAGYVGS